MVRLRAAGVAASSFLALSLLLMAATVSTVSAADDCTVFGTSGNDTFVIGPGLLPSDSIICGGKGNDTLNDAGFTFVTFSGTFYGGQGDDNVDTFPNFAGTFVGGQGNDSMVSLDNGTFHGGQGDDRVGFLGGGWFDGGRGNDSVFEQRGGTYDGGPDSDVLEFDCGGTQLNVETIDPNGPCHRP